MQPWYFYLERLIYFNGWTEALIVILALVGFAVARDLGRWVAIYAVLMVAIYCGIPYKAPWNLLGFLHGLILLAAIGVVWLSKHAPAPAVMALAGIGVAHLGWQAYSASFQFPADPRNPWVYAHTGPDVFAIRDEAAALAAASPGGLTTPIQIISRENLWPLPWYFRRHSQVRWWNGVSMAAPAAPIILATPDMEPDLLHRLYEVAPTGSREMYVNMFDRNIQLRPNVEVRGYVAKSLWDRLP